MHGWQRWRMVLGPRTDDAVGSPVARRALVRVTLLALGVMLVAQGTVHPVRGASDNGATGAASANVQVCEAAGGEANVETLHMDAKGNVIYSVSCDGGYLDGWECVHSSGAGSWHCTTRVIVFSGGVTVPGVGDLAPPVPETNGANDAGAPPSADAPKPASARENLIAPDSDQNQDDTTSKKGKGKHAKKGKKSGKHRKR